MSVRRRSSAHVTLVLAGAAALTGCGRGADSGKRYASQAECVADWGNAEDCKEQVGNDGRGGRGHSWIYYGAASSFFRGSSGLRGGSVHDTSSSPSRSVSRGGFGSTGRSSGVSS